MQRSDPDLDSYQYSKINDNMQSSKYYNVIRCYTSWYNDHRNVIKLFIERQDCLSIKIIRRYYSS